MNEEGIMCPVDRTLNLIIELPQLIEVEVVQNNETRQDLKENFKKTLKIED